MAVASAGPYASLHLAPDRLPRQHLTTDELIDDYFASYVHCTALRACTLYNICIILTMLKLSVFLLVGRFSLQCVAHMCCKEQATVVQVDSGGD